MSVRTKSIRRLAPEELPDYAKMTFPSYQQALSFPIGNQSLIAIGSSIQGQPAGLALATCTHSEAELLSIFTSKQHRNNGLGHQLLEELEHELKDQGCTRIRVTFMDGLASIDPLRVLLHRQSWESPRKKMLFLHYLAAEMAKSPWMRSFPTPRRCTLFQLSDMTEEDARIYRQITSEPSFPKDLDYTSQPYPVVWENSYGLRRDDELIGWMATHLLNDATIRYTSLYVDDLYQKKGYGLPLIFRAIQTHCRDLLHIPRAIQGIPCAFETMIRLAERKLQPYAEKVEHSWEATKDLI